MGIKLNQNAKKADAAMIGEDARRALTNRYLSNVDYTPSFSSYQNYQSVDWLNQIDETAPLEQADEQQQFAAQDAEYAQYDQFDNENSQYADASQDANHEQFYGSEQYLEPASTTDYMSGDEFSGAQSEGMGLDDFSWLSPSANETAASSQIAASNEISVSDELATFNEMEAVQPQPASAETSKADSSGIVVSSVYRSPFSDDFVEAQDAEPVRETKSDTKETLADAQRIVAAFQQQQLEEQQQLEVQQQVVEPQFEDFEQFTTSSEASEIPQTLEEIIMSAAAAPQPGVARTQRGTIEFIMHPTGTAITPKYNRCGILMGIDFNDGSRFVRGNGETAWTALDEQGRELLIQIVGVTLDRRGGVIYVTADGGRTTLHPDGTVTRREFKKSA